MKRVCAWCNKYLGYIESASHPIDAITHGMCKDCLNKVITEMDSLLNDFIEKISAPILVVNKEGIIQTLNNRASIMLNKSKSEVQGHKGGEIFECACIKLPGGCGNTDQCNECTIRKVVLDTFNTGEEHLKITAYLSKEKEFGLVKEKYLISTEKAGDVVLLRIDNILSN